MPPEPVPADPGWDDDPARYATEPEGRWWEEEGYPDPEGEPTAEELAEIRGPAGRAAAFGTKMALDVMPGGPELALFADAAAGADDSYAGASYAGASDDELIGVLGAWDRLEAHVAARKLAAIAELIR